MSNVYLILPDIFKARQCISFASLTGKRWFYIHISLRFRESCGSIVLYIISEIRKYFELTHGVHWKYIHITTNSSRILKFHGIYPNMKFHLKQCIRSRDLSKLTWLQMIGYSKYTVRYTYFGTLQRDSSENILNIILEYNGYIYIYIYIYIFIYIYRIPWSHVCIYICIYIYIYIHDSIYICIYIYIYIYTYMTPWDAWKLWPWAMRVWEISIEVAYVIPG